MSITRAQYDALKDFFDDLFSESDPEHVMQHASFKIDGRHVVFEHDKIDPQEIEWLKEP